MNGNVEPLTKLRAATARRMTESKQSVPHFYVQTEVVLDDALELIRTMNTDAIRSHRVTVTAAIVRAAAEALVAQSVFNTLVTEDGLLRADEINIGVAVALDGGIVAPALRGADRLNLSETAAALQDLVSRARASRLRPAEFADGTFTVSNLGMFDISAFSAIVTPPQVAVIATGGPRQHVAMVDGRPVARTIMTATLSADHRAVDGIDAARFLAAFKLTLECPSTLTSTAREAVRV